MDNNNKFKMACVVARPCNCNAPIAFTSLNDDDDDGAINLILYAIDADLNTSILWETGRFDDYDNLNLICTKCGVSWALFNPLFD